MRIRFADCLFDVEARELWRGLEPVRLSPKALLLLAMLVEARPRPRAQRDLRDGLWPDTHVGYTSLARVVAELRKAIGDTAHPPTMIRTVSRFGYAFAAPSVVEQGAGADGTCILAAADREFTLPEGETLLGRGRECGVPLRSTEVSRVHARIRVAGSTATIEDLGSKNGTRVNGETCSGPTRLASGDEVGIGRFRLVFRQTTGTETTTTQNVDLGPDVKTGG
jgi:DNA-binding winged helix-turn-helix (wHTH) protein